MCARSLMRSLLLVLLAASLSLKLWSSSDARTAGPDYDAIRAGLRDFLAAEGFAAHIEAGMVGLPVAAGERDGCRVALAEVAPQGYHRDLIFSLAAPGDTVAFLFRGQVHPDQPGWATWLSRLSSHLRLTAAEPTTVGGSDRVVALLANGTCRIDTALWAKRLGQRL